jgi:hypothetical protein
MRNIEFTVRVPATTAGNHSFLYVPLLGGLVDIMDG